MPSAYTEHHNNILVPGEADAGEEPRADVGVALDSETSILTIARSIKRIMTGLSRIYEPAGPPYQFSCSLFAHSFSIPYLRAKVEQIGHTHAAGVSARFFGRLIT